MSNSQTLYAYQRRALDTAQPKAFEHEYLIPGIVGEIGELFGHRAKAHWHGSHPNRLKLELVNEYGDICWQTAVLLSTYQIHEVDLTYGEVYQDKDPWLGLLDAAENLYGLWTYDESMIPRSASNLWAYLETHCDEIVGESFGDVLQMNLEKLSDRAARGVLRGSGDHR